jgi:hypothetical protein
MYHNYNPNVTKIINIIHQCVFDCEKKFEPKDETKQSQVTSENTSVSVSIFSNVPEYKVKSRFLCPDKPTIL